MLMSLNRPLALITGASKGIGAATAELFAQQGYDIVINYKSNNDAANKVVAKVHRTGANCIAIQADTATEQGIEQLFKQVDKLNKPLSVVVNNLAILKPQSKLVDMDAARINLILSNNVTSYFLSCREAVKRMSTIHGGQGGAIVNLSSGAARTGSPNEYIDYAASKGAIDTLTKGLAIEVANEGIRVNGVRPALIYTDMHADGGEPMRIERLKDKIPLQRGGKVEEVAQAIYWLASESASFTTGSFIDVTGGL